MTSMPPRTLATTAEPGPEGSTRQGHQHVFERRRVRAAGLVPAPVALVVAMLALAATVLLFSPFLPAGIAAIACLAALAAIVQARARPATYHDASRGVLVVRKGVSWTMLAGFRCTRLPTNVNGNQARLVRHLHGIDPRVTFKIVVSRHEFPRESRSRAGSWFAPKGDDVTTLGAGESGHAWFLVLSRPANLLLGLKHELDALARARDATASMFPNTYPHHQFRAATAGELALLARW